MSTTELDTELWLSACRAAVTGMRSMLSDRSSIAARAVETGTRGCGGDHTLEIDARAEELVFDELQRLHDDNGQRFTRGLRGARQVAFGSEDVLVVVDPIDGSLNAKRGLPHHALSVAVADGRTMADVQFAYVYDFGPAEEWWAARGVGAWLDGERLDPTLQERRGRDGRLEVLGIESADPRWVALAIDELEETRVSSARARHDRIVAVPGRRRAFRWTRVTAQVPGCGCSRRPADRSRGRRARQLPRVCRSAGGAARYDASFASGCGAQ